ncbi:MAG: hypothetical protein MR350_00630 [Alphaproteobacteria bacterium]|nr:hypothetical protein [Alphaproteobacteria bacterium]
MADCRIILQKIQCYLHFLLENTDFLRYFNTTSENVDCVDSQSRFRILA